jgi:predicted alpha-1,2-mannosidase
MIKSLIAMYEEGGWLPKWPNPSYSNVMIGTHADSVIVDAYIKGLRDFDPEKAYEAMYKNAMVSSKDFYEARGGISYYKDFGYIPIDKEVREGGGCRGGGNGRREQVSRTLEFAYDDFCVAQMAKALGKDDDYNLFIKRSYYYKNLFDPSTKFMRGKRSNGSWEKPFDPQTGKGFTESNTWQYTFFVPHDVKGLIDLMGGREAFINRLDMVFQEGQYKHRNEPSHHYTYLYDYAGVPWKTQERVRQTMEEYYGIGPQGLCGNDDCGQMSAWYIFSAVGFYPVCPGMPYYAIGSPLFDKVVIHLDGYWGNKDFIVVAKNNSPKNKYIQSATLNGKPLDRPWIEHSEIINGGTLIFEMGAEPNKEWGRSPEVAPPSMSKEEK